MIGPGQAESIFSVYHVWRANHGFRLMGGEGSPSRRRRGRLEDPASDQSPDGPGNPRLALRGWGRGARCSPSICARTVTRLAQTNPRLRGVGLMIKYLVSEITRPDSAVS